MWEERPFKLTMFEFSNPYTHIGGGKHGAEFMPPLLVYGLPQRKGVGLLQMLCQWCQQICLYTAICSLIA